MEKNFIKKMTFAVKNPIFRFNNKSYSLAEDGSLLPEEPAGDYAVLLGGNWRFTLFVDSSTGVCTHFRAFLDELHVIQRKILIPDSVQKNVFFINESVSLEPGSGCHYVPFQDVTYWDSERRIMCIGDPTAVGTAIKIDQKTIAVIHKGQLLRLYLDLHEVSNIESFIIKDSNRKNRKDQN